MALLDTDQNRTKTGFIVFIGCLGMMCTLLAGDVAKLSSWGDTLYPSFVAGILAHLGAVIGAFFAGKIMPEDANRPQNQRAGDPKP